MRTSDQQILDRVRRIVAEVLRIPVEQVTPDSLLGENLGAESLDFVDIQFRLETHYEVEFYQGIVLDKLAELLAPQKLEENNLLTQFGAVVLRLRMPEVDPVRLQEGRPAAGFETLYTPRTWVRVIKELLSARPQECPNCQSDQLTTAKPSVLVCQKCRTEIRCPTGEECLEAWGRVLPNLCQESQKSSR